MVEIQKVKRKRWIVIGLKLWIMEKKELSSWEGGSPYLAWLKLDRTKQEMVLGHLLEGLRRHRVWWRCRGCLPLCFLGLWLAKRGLDEAASGCPEKNAPENTVSWESRGCSRQQKMSLVRKMITSPVHTPRPGTWYFWREWALVNIKFTHTGHLCSIS